MIFTSLDPHDYSGPTVKTIWGAELTLDAAEQEIERLEEKIDAYLNELAKQHDSAHRKRLRRKLESLEAEHQVLWSATHPIYSDEDGLLCDGFNPGALVACRSTACNHYLLRSLAQSATMGFCPLCWEKASPPTTTEGR